MVQTLLARGIPIREYRHTRDKVSRASSASVWYENGKAYHCVNASWLADLEAELLMFPNASHDDCTDVVSMACDEMLLDDGDIPFCMTVRTPSTLAFLPRTYRPEPGEMEVAEAEKIARRQEQVGRFLQQIHLIFTILLGLITPVLLALWIRKRSRKSSQQPEVDAGSYSRVPKD